MISVVDFVIVVQMALAPHSYNPMYVIIKWGVSAFCGLQRGETLMTASLASIRANSPPMYSVVSARRR